MQSPISPSKVSEYDKHTYSSKNLKATKILASSDFPDDLNSSIYSKNLERENPNPSSLGQTKSSQSKLHNMNKSKGLNDENDHIKSNNKIPTPYAWSPSISKSLNPSISITPEKPNNNHSDLDKFCTGNYYEENVLSRVPQPMAWSPGMVIKPNPTLFITPDKSTKKVVGNLPEYDYANSVLILKTLENLNNNNKITKHKEKQCVRFDLPSASSGEETLDENSSSESPITLKGSEINNCSSPVWKPFSLQKNYNPNDYSDDSVLDDSSLNTSKTYFKNALVFKTSQDMEDIQIDGPVNTQKTLVDGSSKTAKLNTALIQQKKKNTLKTLTTIESDYKNSVKSTKNHVVLSKPDSDSQNKKSKKPQHTKDELKFPRSSSDSSLTPALSIVREERSKLSSTEYCYPFHFKGVIGDDENEHVFARPEFNSTLKLRSELDSMHLQEVDTLGALEAVLDKSETKRTELNEKAATCTNRSSNQFKDLIDLDPSLETLCERVVRMRTNQLPNRAKSTKVDKKTSDKAPDLLEFFTSDLQKEAPDLSMPGMTFVAPQLAIAPHEVAFDLYRHNRIWLDVNDF